MRLGKKSMLFLILSACVLAAAAGAFFLLRGGDSAEAQQMAAVEAAESWIKNSSPTFLFDGTGLELREVEGLAREGAGPAAYVMVFEFESRHAGYGDRAGEMLAQVITPHQLEVRVERDPEVGGWKIVRAVTDGKFDEMAGEFLEDLGTRETRRVDLYFMRVVDGQEEPVAVSRDLSAAERVGNAAGLQGADGVNGMEVAALEALLEGPRPVEAEQEYYSAIPEGVEIEEFALRSGTAYVSFSAELEKGVAGSAWVQAIRDQIRLTLLQFEEIEAVEIAVKGRTEGILQP